MNNLKNVLPKLPGWIASILMILSSAFAAYWSSGELYHEGWWGAWYNPLLYLLPLVVILLPTLIAFRWPLVGGGLIIASGIFALFFFSNDVAFFGLAIAFVGAGFVIDGLIRRRYPPAETASLRWWRRNWRYLLALGIPTLIMIGASAYMLPVVLTRVDDGDRSARLIEGNEVNLIWAPEGPGWNWQQEWGGYPSWQSIALYGVPPVGLGDKLGYGPQDAETRVFASAEDMAATNLCLYLNAAGTDLVDEPQHIWRMPTTAEIVSSLGRHGENAGCTWRGEYREQVQCDILPDKESPLWRTDQPVIYYWTADSYDTRNGYFVAFNGTVNAAYKPGGNPRHGYRCVREP